ARCRDGSRKAKRKVLAWGVSSFTNVTVAASHCMVMVSEAGDAASVTLIALLEPRVATVVVAVALPEPLLVVVEQAQTADPLGALPEVQVRHQEPGRAAVLTSQRASVDIPHDSGLTVGDVGERQVRGVAGVAEGEHVGGRRRRLGRGEQR